MTDAQLQSLTAQVLWSAFGFAVLFGAVAQRSHFCTMGAVSDAMTMGDWARVRQWALAAGIAVLGFHAMVGLGWIEARQSIYAAPRLVWLSHALGGLMFGFGMVLASGCGSKSLVRAGGGNLKSLVVLVVLGVSAYATLRGVAAVARVATVDQVALTLPTGQDLPSLLALATGAPRTTMAWLAGGAIGLALVAFALARPAGRSAEVLLGGLGVGAAIVGLWWVSGRLGHVMEHPQTLEEVFVATNSQRMESLSFVAPVAYTFDWLILFSDKSKVLTLGIVSTLGVMLGSAVTALATGVFRWEGFAGAEDTANHLVGAVLMGVGGITALGCTIGQGLSGLSTLSLGSFIAVAGIVAGAVLAIRWQAMRIERAA
jgi:uncharacterized membrane protein YedE/YeeE